MEPKDDSNGERYQIDKIWWIKQIVLVIIGGFYLYFGIHLLISSYGINNPFSFIVTFFASNFIILISGALLVGFIYRMITVFRQLRNLD